METKPAVMTITTPRGTFKIHTVYDTYGAAKADGWGFWFQAYHGGEPYGIMTRDNRSGAVVNGIYSN